LILASVFCRLRLLDAIPHTATYLGRYPQMREIKLFLIALALIVTINVYAQDTAKQAVLSSLAEAPTCVVQGKVVSAVTGEPLKSAIVQLIDRSHAEPPRAVTDSSGHFVIKGVPPGSYHFRASKVGYVEQAYKTDANGPAELLVLAAGQKLEKVLFRLNRAAVVIGRITDEAGEPVEGARILALVSRTKLGDWGYPGSVSQIVPLQFALTNDLGEYRLYNLPPGSYYLAVLDNARVGELSPRGLGWTIGLERETNHPPIYFPGVYKASEAQKVRVNAGQESRIDLSLRPTKMLTISGRVLGPTGKPEANISVNLSSEGGATEVTSSSWGSPTDADGNFKIKGVFPGSYTISADHRPLSAEDNRYWAEQRIEVAGENVSGLQLQLSGGLELSGKLTTVGGLKLDFQGIVVMLYAEGESTFLGEVSADVKKDGTFTLAQVRRGVKRLYLRGLTDGWYVRSAVFAGQNVLEDGLKLAEADAGHSLEITITSAVGRIEGVVLKGDAPVSGAMVKLLPDPANSHRRDLVRTEWADHDGYFVIDNLAPGGYRVQAVDVESDPENDDDDSPAGISVVLAERESKTVQLRLDKTHE
jgi:protocatechuate 3,4-dioxygenase beta subunit